MITLKFIVLIEDTDTGALSSMAVTGEQLQLKQLMPGKTVLGRTATMPDGKEVFQTFVTFQADVSVPKEPKAPKKATKKASKQ